MCHVAQTELIRPVGPVYLDCGLGCHIWNGVTWPGAGPRS